MRPPPTVSRTRPGYDDEDNPATLEPKEHLMNTHFTLRAAVIAALAGLALAACDRDATNVNANNNSAERAGAAVGRQIDTAVDKTQQTLADAGQKTEEKLDAAGQKIAAATDRAVANTKEAANDMKTEIKSGDTGRAMNDTAITASIKTDYLKDPDLSVLKIDVDTKDGVVTLNGLADNDAARVRAEKLAQSIKGVREVRNFLTVKRA
jgi:hyperosmotically inducible periplasmic protein